MSILGRWPSSGRKRANRPWIEGVVYAIGDIHGQGDLAHALLQTITDEISASQGGGIIVTLGDYVDRGPHSRYVLDLLISLKRYPLIETHLLRGNHEEAMIAFIEGRAEGHAWLDYGGMDTLKSYGVAPPASPEPDDLEVCRQALVKALPRAHRKLLDGLELSYRRGDYFFAHAGAAPGVALGEQSPKDLMWIRKRFLESRVLFEQVIVHGHTPEDDVHADYRRLGIDTGAYLTGILSAVRLEGETQEIIQALRRRDGVEIDRRQIAQGDPG
jgi:serine/threonine protein phosphatase 1